MAAALGALGIAGAAGGAAGGAGLAGATGGELAGLAAKAGGGSPFNGSGMFKSFGNGPQGMTGGQVLGSLMGSAGGGMQSGGGGKGGRAAAKDMSGFAFDPAVGGFMNYVNSPQADPEQMQSLFKFAAGMNNQPQRQPISPFQAMHSLYVQNLLRGMSR